MFRLLLTIDTTIYLSAKYFKLLYYKKGKAISVAGREGP
jgi:hypothetical protein